VSVERPQSTPPGAGTGHHAAINGQTVSMPERFVLTGTFIEPKKLSLVPNQAPPEGTYAAAILLSLDGLLTGATSQFRPSGQRLNTPRITIPNSPQDRPDIALSLQNNVMD